MSETRRLAAMIVLFLIGFGMVVLADVVDSSWPLFVTPLPYAAIPWLVVTQDRASGGGGLERGADEGGG